MNHAPLRVIKLGGSLLEVPELATRFRAWHSSQPPNASVIIAGGGPLCDLIRAADRVHRLGNEASHWLCIRAMTITSEIVAKLLPEAQLLRALDELRAHGREGHPLLILDVQDFMRRDQHAELPLPASWDVTSDSIAARIADATVAAELVLLKSALPTGGDDLESAAAKGYVDPYFPIAAAGSFAIRCVDLRAHGFPESRLR